MMEILSIGKSMKIIKYLETTNKGLDQKFEEYLDFKKLYDNLKSLHLKTPPTNAPYLDPTLTTLTETHLSRTQWTPAFQVLDLLSVSPDMAAYRDLL
jgi:hypothetical protein